MQTSLELVDTTHMNQQIKILCKSEINLNGTQQSEPIQLKYHLYRQLPKSLRRLCGRISIPPDGGKKLMAYVKDDETALLGVSDASIKNGCGTHAWILTTGEMEHMSDPCMKLEGSGPVDGDPYTMSSARGELQGQTALAIVTSTLLKEHDAQNTPVSFYTYNWTVRDFYALDKYSRK
jgi:hypothetical protein